MRTASILCSVRNAAIAGILYEAGAMTAQWATIRRLLIPQRVECKNPGR